MGPHSREPRNVKTQKCGALRNPKRCIFVSQLFQFSKNSSFKTSKPSPTTQKSKFFTSRFPQISRLPRLFCCLLNRVRSTYIYSNLLTTKKPPTPPPISPEIRQIASSTRQTENSLPLPFQPKHPCTTPSSVKKHLLQLKHQNHQFPKI